MSQQNNKPETVRKASTDKKEDEAFEKVKEFFARPLVSLASGGLIGYALGKSGKTKALDLEKAETLMLERKLKQARTEIEHLKEQNQQQDKEIVKLRMDLSIITMKEDIQKKCPLPPPQEKQLIHYLNNDPKEGYGKISIN